VAVGIGTVLADDPRLLPTPVPRRSFTRIVLDARLRLPLDSRLVGSARRHPVLALCAAGAPAARRRRLEAAGVEVVGLPSAGGRVSLERALRALWERGVTSIMVEGGSEVLGEFLAAGLLDQVALFRAPLLLGGRDSLPAFGGPNPQRVSLARRLEMVPAAETGLGVVGRDEGLFEVWYPVGRGRRH
jgi:diaminohydroxyphosphoribosylaminopyrimidine deaminase/5-amino-6-(5-phosphoribosylamino)uracil reductase